MPNVHDTLGAYFDKQLIGVRHALKRHTNDIVGFRSIDDIELYFECEHRAKPRYLPHRGRKKAFVFETKHDNELWIDIHEGKSVWINAFRNYLKLYHGIDNLSLAKEGFSIDHSYPRYMGRREGLTLSRLYLVDSAVNSSWGNWEEHFTENDRREGRTFAFMTYSQMLKVSGFRGPRLPVSDAYIDRAAAHLIDLDLEKADTGHLQLGLRHYLVRGNYVRPSTS